jgi:hypothetical protein
MRLAPALICLALVLAGCNTAFGPAARSTPTATPTDTPTATPTPSTEAPNPRDVGLAADGVVEPLTLRTAHTRSLENRSYTLTRSTTVRRPNGSVVVSVDRVVASGPNRDRFVWNMTREIAPSAGFWLEDLYGGPSAVRAYSNESATLVEVAATDDQRSVSRYPERSNSETPFSGPYRDFTGQDLVMNTFLRVDTRVTDIERADGRVRYHLAATDGPHVLRFDTSFELEGRVLELASTIERSGRVRELVVRYALVHENETIVVRESLRIRGVGTTTVDRPAWADDLAATTTPAPHLARAGPHEHRARSTP